VQQRCTDQTLARTQIGSDHGMAADATHSLASASAEPSDPGFGIAED